MTVGSGTDQVSEIEVDVEALTRRYAEERAKRIRSDGSTQYEELRASRLVDSSDPFVDPDFTRDPVVREVDALIVGGGFAGLLAGANLRKVGVEDICIVDKAGDFGGTWYWNRYPGVSCDVESYIYMPLLEDTGYMPSMKYSPGKEIREYAQLIARTFKLYDGALFQTMATEFTWDDTRRRWIVAHLPRRRDCGTFRDLMHRPVRRRQGAADSRHRGFRGAHVPHQPVGLRLHRR